MPHQRAELEPHQASSEVVSVGDTIEVYVKDIDTENHKVSLGYKKSEDNPWEQLKNNYPIGSTFHAPVVSLTKFVHSSASCRVLTVWSTSARSAMTALRRSLTH